MNNLASLSVAERLYGLSLIWQEANYNFAFFDRVPELDWDAAYRDYIPQVIAAEDLIAYYELLMRFTALLQDGHTMLIPPKSVCLALDRPKLMLMNVENVPVVTNTSQEIANRVPIGSRVLKVDGVPAAEYLATCVMPSVCETTHHRRLAQATARMLQGAAGSQVTCSFLTPSGDTNDVALVRDRHTSPAPWLRPPGAPEKWEVMDFYEWFFNETPLTPFVFQRLEGNLAYVALNTFMDPTVATSFEEKLPEMQRYAGLILDMRKNHGGNDDFGYRIVRHLLRQTTETLHVQTPKHVASYRAWGVSLKDMPADQVATLDEDAKEGLLCYKRQWRHEMNWGTLSPDPEHLALPVAILTSPETGSAAEDFLMAFQSGKGNGIRIGSSTAGSTGQPLIEDLPGGGMLGVCTVRMPWPEGIWRKGIEPDMHVEPTIEDVIHDEDRVLQTAVRHLCGVQEP